MRESRGVCRIAGREIEFGEEKLELQPLKGAIDCEHLRHRSSDALYETYVFRELRKSCEPGRELPPLLRALLAFPLFPRGGISSVPGRWRRRHPDVRPGC